jgi:hypothetical protein
MMRSLVAALVSTSLIASPALAEVSIPTTAPAAAPAMERVEGQQALGSAIWWVVGAIVVGALVLFLVLGDDDDDLPASP